MRIYERENKPIPGWGYWGNYGEIDMGFSVSYVPDLKFFQGDKLHYHREGTMYMIVLQGEGLLEVDGKEVVMKEGQLIRIDHGEKYRHTGIRKAPLHWISVCSNKDPQDKVVVE